MLLFLLILAITALAQLFLPWWIVAPIAFLLAARLGRTGGRSFLAGFAGVGLGWAVVAAWRNVGNDGLLAHRVAQLLPLGGSSWALVLVTAIVGGLVGGVAALAGCWLRQALQTTATPAERSTVR
ncbi:hypothetical protein [Hymenobacter sp. GOD-10R]|uniref:hypothetical protein n=1 Tax=Hymenobacter sp. GOD-10R TaxID=3093922 RepID=UPI002D79225F|nr:hypothetical protein [Hymenobacter sp. GOD-10R]WRQ28191.1 hypothetical protein SD425_24300 [Hymenobacter sp. GOD-10R]